MLGEMTNLCGGGLNKNILRKYISLLLALPGDKEARDEADDEGADDGCDHCHHQLLRTVGPLNLSNLHMVHIYIYSSL